MLEGTLHVPEDKGHQGHPTTYNSNLPARHTGATVSQMLWGKTLFVRI